MSSHFPNGASSRSTYRRDHVLYLTHASAFIHADSRYEVSDVYYSLRMFYDISGSPGTSPWQLYDLSTDPGERRDLATQNPDLVTELVEEWGTNWR